MGENYSEFFVGHFEFCWVIFIMTTRLDFFFSSHFELEFQLSDFRIRTSDIQISEVSTELLYFYIDIYLFVKWKHTQKAQ